MLRPEVREALFVSSSGLDEELNIWLDNPESKRTGRIERGVLRYYLRMCGRATPFELCAGFSVGILAKHTSLILAGRESYRRHIRLRMEYLSALIGTLTRQPEVRKLLRYQPNSSLYEAGGRLHYVQCEMDGKAPSYLQIAVEKTDYLMATLRRANRGARVQKLAKALVDDEVELEDAQAYVDVLISSQILIPDLNCSVTGNEPLESLTSLDRCGEHASFVKSVVTLVRSQLAAMDSEGLGRPTHCYRDIAKHAWKVFHPARNLTRSFTRT